MTKPLQDRTTSHTRLVDEIRLALGGIADVVLWPNPVKLLQCIAHDGKVFRTRTGLCEGSADLVGICAGRFFAVEAKTGNARLEKHQAQWAELVRAKGGFAAVARSADEARAAVERCRRGERE